MGLLGTPAVLFADRGIMALFALTVHVKGGTNKMFSQNQIMEKEGVMGHNKHFLKVICFCFASVTILGLMASSAEAQQEACVYLKPGSGYAAEMRITSGSWSTSWSGSFAIGSTKCQPIANLKTGAAYTVEVKAIMGETKSCPQGSYDPNFTGNITYLASGTTLSVKCVLPSAEEMKEK